MTPTLAATSFQSGADEKLAATDVYAAPPQGPIGAISDTVGTSKSLLGLDKFLPKTGGLNGLLSGDLGKVLGGSFGSLEQGIKTVTGVLKGDKSLLADLQKGMVGNLLASAGLGESAMTMAGSLLSGGSPMSALGALAANNPDMRLIMDGVDTIVKVKDVKSIEDLLAVADKLTGMKGLGEILQIGPQLGMMKSLIDTANVLGVPELANAIIARVDNVKDKKALRIAAAQGAAEGSNLDMLNATLNEHGNDGMIGMYPSLVKTLLSNYRFEDESVVPTKALANTLITMCNNLDVNWLYVKRGETLVPDLDCLLSLSSDARTLFYMDDAMRPIAMTASGYNVDSLIGLAQKQYPYTPMILSA